MKMNKILKNSLIGLLVFGVSVAAISQEISIFKKDGSSLRGIFVKADPNGDIWLKQGQVQQKLKAVDYSYARLKDKPKEISDAEKLANSKDYAKAAAAFAEAFEKYRFVGYDVLCIYGEANALASQDKKDAAIARLKMLDGYELLDEEKTTEFYEARKLLASLLIDQSKFDDAMKILGELGQSNDSDIATFGFNSRANILLKQGKKKEALLMYFRTALLFPVENKERPFALLQIANILKEMQDNRGAIFAEMLKTEYPGNPLIAQLK